jgi:transaldolase/glucose-6-phosphate isomerase
MIWFGERKNMNQAVKLNVLGQSIWYDNIRRALIEDGSLMERIERREIYGVTSNPSIFRNAIADSDDYAAALQTLSWAGLDAKSIFYHLAIKDIRDVADLFGAYYEATDGADGYVSLEVNPNLANDTQGTIDEALWLWEEVARPNLMVKIPATKAGLPAITEVIAAGVNVNVTLIFSRKRYLEVMEAYLAGLEKRAAAGLDISYIASVASFFVSRLDSKADKRLQAIIDEGGPNAETAKQLKGKLAIDNTRLAYQDYETFFGSKRFAALAAKGAQTQRPLWASTSTKDPAYSDVLYVDSLVAANSVNTVPPETLDAFLDHGEARITINDDLDRAEKDFEALAGLGISIDVLTRELEEEGVQKFAEAFQDLLDVIEAQRQNALAGMDDPLKRLVSDYVRYYSQENAISRLLRFDPTLWTNDASGKNTVQTRLGWVALPDESQGFIENLYDFTDDVMEDGFEKVLLLGMGGSSLAPETLSLIFGEYVEGLELKILDSTVPGQVAEAEAWVDYGKTLFIVASKSGTTTEPMSFYAYFAGQAEAKIGESWAKHFIAITDPGSHLAQLASEKGFRATFTANPNVGGRYSALTHFGMVPAALMGIDLSQFLWSASDMAAQCANPIVEDNPGAMLGLLIGSAVKLGMDKLTFIADSPVQPLGAWLEQLIAESSGKEGKGIVPVADEPLMSPEDYSPDRLFVHLRANGENDDIVAALKEAGKPVLVNDVPYLYNLGGEFYRWEFAIAIACSVIGVNAFDQPDVQDSKDRTKAKLNVFMETGSLPESETLVEFGDVKLYGDLFEGLSECKTLADVIGAFTALAGDGDYIAINAYLPRNGANEAKLVALRDRILKANGKATTLGFGPRFLHSTGQLHKGGANNGVFLQITQADSSDLAIPGVPYSFSVLAQAQAKGDLEALESRGRRALRVHLPVGDALNF